MGTGDGAYVIENARKNPNNFFIGLDSNADNMRECSRKTEEFKKHGLPNALFVHAGMEALPEELMGMANEITVLLPWGSLLKAVAKPEVSLLKNLASLFRDSKDSRVLRVVLGYDHEAERNMVESLGLPALTEEYLDTKLRNGYLEAGFKIRWRFIKQEDIKQVGTTWAKKLAYGKGRRFVEIIARPLELGSRLHGDDATVS
jgi:16S rRNA (adenine(1408)-N(1))-methyltransferase